jgi:hypothetical protein
VTGYRDRVWRKDAKCSFQNKGAALVGRQKLKQKRRFKGIVLHSKMFCGIKDKVKVKVTLEQSTRTQRWSRGIAPFFL